MFVVAVSAIHGCVSISPKKVQLPKIFCMPTVERCVDSSANNSTIGLLRLSLPYYAERNVFFSKIASGEIKLRENIEWAEPINTAAYRVLIAHLNNSSKKVSVSAVPAIDTFSFSGYISVEFDDFAHYSDEGFFKISGKWTHYSKDNTTLTSAYFSIKIQTAETPEQLVQAISFALKALARDVCSELDNCLSDKTDYQ